jgi:sorbitol/mannitol transport system permease protein
MANTLALVGGVLVITVVGGILIALLLDQPVKGQGIVRILVIAPFFVMPPVAASIWKTCSCTPERACSPRWRAGFGAQPIDCFALPAALDHPHRRLAMAALRHADPADRAAIARRRAEGGGRDGRRRRLRPLRYIILPHLARAITVVILIQTIFLLGSCRDLRHHQGRARIASTNLPFMIFKQARWRRTSAAPRPAASSR